MTASTLSATAIWPGTAYGDSYGYGGGGGGSYDDSYGGGGSSYPNESDYRNGYGAGYGAVGGYSGEHGDERGAASRDIQQEDYPHQGVPGRVWVRLFGER